MRAIRDRPPLIPYAVSVTPPCSALSAELFWRKFSGSAIILACALLVRIHADSEGLIPPSDTQLDAVNRIPVWWPRQ